METIRVKIKKSKNVHAWSNNSVGQIITVIKNGGFGYEDGYKVDFKENPNIRYVDQWLTGILKFEDAEII